MFDDREFSALTIARDVLQKEIDERLKIRRQEMLKNDCFYVNRKTRRLADYFSELGFRIVSCVGKEQVFKETRAANLMYKIKDVAVPIFRRLVAKCSNEVTEELDRYDGVTKNLLLQLCYEFERLKWIKEEHTKHILKITRLNDSEATNFWHGAWAEYVHRSLVVQTLQNFAKSHNKCRYDVFFDIKLVRCESTGKPVDMQLDLVVQFSKRFYVFETKTGVLCIDKWVDRARLFGRDDRSRFITCCADENISSKLFEPYVLMPLGRMPEQLKEIFEQDFSVDTLKG